MTKPTTCSYKPSKKLYDMGIRIDSYFCWYKDAKGRIKVFASQQNLKIAEKMGYSLLCPVPNPQELLDVIRPLQKKRIYIHMGTDDSNKYWAVIQVDDDDLDASFHNDTKLANAIADTLIWMIENEHTTVEEVNKCLI
jgi:hypothetical protein